VRVKRAWLGVVLVAACGGATGKSDGAVTLDLAGAADLAAAGDLAATGDLSVPLTGLAIGGASPMIPGAGADLTATASYGDGTSRDVTASATFASSALSVATLSGAHVDAIAAGSTMITATYGGLTAPAVALTVKAVTALSVVAPGADPTQATSPPSGPALQYTATATFMDSSTADVTKNARVSWSSTDTGIATVTGGLAMPSNNNGFTNIGATYGGKSAMAGLLVMP
jgi:hypothetical protein